MKMETNIRKKIHLSFFMMILDLINSALMTHTAHAIDAYTDNLEQSYEWNVRYHFVFLTGGLLDITPIITAAISFVANAALLLGSLK